MKISSIAWQLETADALGPLSYLCGEMAFNIANKVDCHTVSRCQFNLIEYRMSTFLLESIKISRALINVKRPWE